MPLSAFRTFMGVHQRGRVYPVEGANARTALWHALTRFIDHDPAVCRHPECHDGHEAPHAHRDDQPSRGP